ncbi:MAG: Lar family restriction alleviation protein [Oscillospiraceae bacterium]|nr:Lar family restriction alleviation protein [Oscillospiraceae bacterium]
MDIHERFVLQDCPRCGGPGLLDEESGGWIYAVCMDCGAQTAPFEFNTPEEREAAAEKVATLWNVGKVIRQENGE